MQNFLMGNIIKSLVSILEKYRLRHLCLQHIIAYIHHFRGLHITPFPNAGQMKIPELWTDKIYEFYRRGAFYILFLGASTMECMQSDAPLCFNQHGLLRAAHVTGARLGAFGCHALHLPHGCHNIGVIYTSTKNQPILLVWTYETKEENDLAEVS